MEKTNNIHLARKRLIETGGRTSQDLGLGRIVGQVLVYLYLQPTECSLEDLEKDIGLSKASVSIAARQLETLGLVSRVWVKGDRKKYYRSTENIASALQRGLLTQFRQKVNWFGEELDVSLELLDGAATSADVAEVDFLKKRVVRAKNLQGRLSSILGNSLVKLLSKAMQ